MKRITINRNKNADELGCAGDISGETDDGRRWILFFDASGKPEVYWPDRDADGGVIGDRGIMLDRVPGQFSGVFEMLGVPDDADCADEALDVPEVISAFPIFHPDDTVFEYDDQGRITNDSLGCMRGVVFAVVPGDGLNPNQRMRQFISALSSGWGFLSGEQRMAKMRQILDSDPDPAAVVARLRAALTAMDDASDEEWAAIEALRDRNTTQEVVPVTGAGATSTR